MIQQTKKFFVFSIGGGLGAIINWTITVTLTEIFHMWYILSYSIGLAINLIFNFIYHQNITFKKKDRWKKRFTFFTVVSILTIILNLLSVYLVTELLQIFYLISIIFITILIAILNFVLNKEIVFK